jgi:mannosyltransferase OCH1-like enzyme
MQQQIPHIVMQTWKTGSINIPEQWREAHESVKRELGGRGWRCVVLSDDDIEAFVKREYPDLWPLFESYDYGIQRSDAVRPLWLKLYGGIYMDMDYFVQPNKVLDDLFQEGGGRSASAYLIRSGNSRRRYTNSFMAGLPDAPLWDAYIEEMKVRGNKGSWWALTKHWKVLSTAGPLCLDAAVRGLDASLSSAVYTIPPTYIMNCSICDLAKDAGCKRSADAYLTPIAGGSWNGSDTRFYNFMYCNSRVLLMLFATLSAVFVGVGVVIFLSMK